MQLLIYAPQVTPRIKYIFNFIFREVLNCDFELTSIAADFIQHGLPKLSYAEQPLADELFFRCSTLLNKHHIEAIAIEETLFGDQKVPFAVTNSTLPFDVFAASFFFLSRYEEYLPYVADAHQRFPATQSLQYKLDLLELPIIDGWAMVLKNILLKKFPSLTFGSRKFTFVSTIDVDRAYHFRSNGVAKNATRLFKSILKLDAKKIADMIRTGLGQSDPFDTFAYLANLHERYHIKPIFFFLLAKHGHQDFDQNISPEDEAFQTLIANVAKKAQVGLHPSYASNTATQKIGEELLALQTLIDRKIDQSRQHFIKLHLPHTYLQLIKAGINHDYSMGYSSHVGFRAGTCTPFFWYDLQLEKQSHLKIHPFAVMDVTLQHYLKLNPDGAKQKIDALLANVKLVNGTFCSLWHNESLSETGRWAGWKAVYEFLLNETSDQHNGH